MTYIYCTIFTVNITLWAIAEIFAPEADKSCCGRNKWFWVGMFLLFALFL